MRELAGRTAIVTGASRGIGVYIARALSRENMNLALAARSADALEDLKAELVARGNGGVVAVPTDVSDDAALRNLLQRSEAEFGAVDVLVNNAGIEAVLTFHKLALAEIDELLDVNLKAAMHLAWMVLPGMVERRRGHIVNISSLAGKAGPARCEPYAASKAGLVGFTQSLRASYRRRDGVSASVVCPGFVDAGMYSKEAREAVGEEAPSNLVSKPEAVADAVVRAIKQDLMEVIVNPLPVRPLLALLALAPGVTERLSRLVDSNPLFFRQAAVREAERERVRASN